MSGKEQRKGRRGEIELAELLRTFGYDARPGSPMNYGSEPDVYGVPGLHIECKRHEQLRIPAWMKQATEDAEKFGDGTPVVFFRRNNDMWHVVLKMTDFMRIYRGRR